MKDEGLEYEAGTPLYVYPRVNGWSNLTQEGTGRPVNVQGSRATGFLLFYESREDYDRDHPGEPPVVVYSQGS